MRRWFRTLSVVLRLAPYFLAFLRDRRRWVVLGRPARRSPRSHERRAERLAHTLAVFGPTFIKLAQLFSSRADIMPEPYLSAIGKLQDQAPPDPPDEIIRVIESELGGTLDEHFADFERDPVAAASLGQVHRARVNGRDVVIKVLRPGVEDLVALDLDISFRILFWLNVVFPNHHVRALTNVIREFSVRVLEEMDFRHEADNIELFRTHFSRDSRVHVPEILDEFTTQRVLVMEHCVGTKVDALHDHFESGTLNLGKVMTGLTSVYLRMMMVDGFLHGDPHPGNILIQDDGTIVLLDWGMVVRVPRWTRETILGLALAVEREDLDAMINGMYRLRMISPEVSRGEVREAATEIMRIVENAKTSNRDRVHQIVQEIFDTFYTWPLLLPQEMVYFFRTSILLEGLGIRYDPSFDGLGLVKEVVRSSRTEIAKTAGKEPVALAKDLVSDAQNVIRSIRDLLTRTEREELRVRVHPRDIQGQERFIHLQARRILLSIFATATAVITSILFVALNNLWLLGIGLAISLTMFLLILFIPTHLLENPLRHARGIRPLDRRR